MLPVTQHARIAAIGFQTVEQGQAPELAQTLVEAAAEGTEIPVLAITEGQYGIFQRLRMNAIGGEPLLEAGRIVRCLAFAVGADDEQDARGRPVVRVQRIERQQQRLLARVAQLRCAAFGEVLCLTALAGIGDHQLCRAIDGRARAQPSMPAA